MILSSSSSASAFDRDEQRRRRIVEILRVSAAMFNRRGFGGTSLEDVAAELKISKASIYNYVENKQKLLFEVYKRAFEFNTLATERAEQASGTGLERLKVFLENQIELMLDPDHGPVAVLSEIHSLADEDRIIIRKMLRDQDSRIRVIIEKGLEDGSIRAEDAARIEFIIMGTVNWIPKWFHTGGAWTARDMSRSVINLIVHGIAAEPANPS